jgi:hypothetical protein
MHQLATIVLQRNQRLLLSLSPELPELELEGPKTVWLDGNLGARLVYVKDSGQPGVLPPLTLDSHDLLNPVA